MSSSVVHKPSISWLFCCKPKKQFSNFNDFKKAKTFTADNVKDFLLNCNTSSRFGNIRKNTKKFIKLFEDLELARGFRNASSKRQAIKDGGLNAIKLLRNQKKHSCADDLQRLVNGIAKKVTTAFSLAARPGFHIADSALMQGIQSLPDGQSNVSALNSFSSPVREGGFEGVFEEPNEGMGNVTAESAGRPTLANEGFPRPVSPAFSDDNYGFDKGEEGVFEFFDPPVQHRSENNDHLTPAGPKTKAKAYGFGVDGDGYSSDEDGSVHSSNSTASTHTPSPQQAWELGGNDSGGSAKKTTKHQTLGRNAGSKAVFRLEAFNSNNPYDSDGSYISDTFDGFGEDNC